MGRGNTYDSVNLKNDGFSKRSDFKGERENSRNPIYNVRILDMFPAPEILGSQYVIVREGGRR
jgi:hypothetical protein